MFNSFSKGCLSTLLALLSLSTMNASLAAWDSYDSCGDAPCNRFYIGGFGGGLFSDSTKLSQMGTAFFIEEVGGPLSIYAKGHSKKKSVGFGGVQLGYEWAQCPINIGCTDWTITTAAELEALFYNHKHKGHLINDIRRLNEHGLIEHDFVDSFHANTSVILGNVVFAINSPCLCGIVPYVGGGIGAAHISLKKANSKQVSPPELGVNHFNSKRHDDTWAFAAEVKAGVRYKFFENLNVFAEYRYLFLDSSNYILGSTVYPGHAPTSPWNVKMRNTNYNAFAVGIQYDL